MKKLLIIVCIALSSMATLGQWGMMQSQITPQQIDALFAALPPERRQAGVVGYWQDVVNAARSGNIVQQQSVISIAPIIRKYDSQYQEHLHAAMQVAAFMSVCDNMGGGQSVMPMPAPNPMPMPAFGGGGRSGMCPVCYGSGNCKICHGTGTYRSGGQAVPCDRKCSACGGTGRR
ncbi:MAG: hypothetical protein IJ173_06785 [Kiritimatiellae bacterium]|nr:hypothetical protein [Kiritimatiellia bacterium]